MVAASRSREGGRERGGARESALDWRAKIRSEVGIKSESNHLRMSKKIRGRRKKEIGARRISGDLPSVDFWLAAMLSMGEDANTGVAKRVLPRL